VYSARPVAQILDVRRPEDTGPETNDTDMGTHSGSNLGWQGLIHVDGKAYAWMGDAPGFDHVKQVSLHYTATKSEFVFDVDGKVHLTVTFLSPVYPDDLSRQSQQFSYISAKVSCFDSEKRNVQVYMDVSGGETIPEVPTKIQGLLTDKMNRVGQWRRLPDHQMGARGYWQQCGRHVPQVLSR